jgi:iron complex outermembrane receptor protein
VESARAYGVETGIEGRWTDGWLARASYSAQRTEDGDTGDELSNAPRHLAKFHLRVPLWKDRIFAGGEVLYASSVQATKGGRVAGYWLANLTLFSQEIVKGLELSASIYNLFNTSYAQTPSDEHLQRVIPQDGRSFRLKLTYKF